MAFVALTLGALLDVLFSADPSARLPPPEPIADKGQPEDLQAPRQGQQDFPQMPPVQGKQGFPQRPPGEEGFPQRPPIQGQQGFPQRRPSQGKSVPGIPPSRGSNVPQSMPQPDMRQGRQIVGAFVPFHGYGRYGHYSALGPWV